MSHFVYLRKIFCAVHVITTDTVHAFIFNIHYLQIFITFRLFTGLIIHVFFLLLCPPQSLATLLSLVALPHGEVGQRDSRTSSGLSIFQQFGRRFDGLEREVMLKATQGFLLWTCPCFIFNSHNPQIIELALFINLGRISHLLYNVNFFYNIFINGTNSCFIRNNF